MLNMQHFKNQQSNQFHFHLVSNLSNNTHSSIVNLLLVSHSHKTASWALSHPTVSRTATVLVFSLCLHLFVASKTMHFVDANPSATLVSKTRNLSALVPNHFIRVLYAPPFFHPPLPLSISQHLKRHRWHHSLPHVILFPMAAVCHLPTCLVSHLVKVSNLLASVHSRAATSTKSCFLSRSVSSPSSVFPTTNFFLSSASQLTAAYSKFAVVVLLDVHFLRRSHCSLTKGNFYLVTVLLWHSTRPSFTHSSHRATSEHLLFLWWWNEI